MSDPIEQAIQSAARDYFEARDHLQDVIQAACGDHHRPLQHRDGKAPWCPNCGRTAQGTKVREP